MIHTIPCYDFRSIFYQVKIKDVSLDIDPDVDDKTIWNETIKQFGCFTQTDNRPVIVTASYIDYESKKRDVYLYRNVNELFKNYEQLKTILYLNNGISQINTFVIENIEMVS